MTTDSFDVMKKKNFYTIIIGYYYNYYTAGAK